MAITVLILLTSCAVDNPGFGVLQRPVTGSETTGSSAASSTYAAETTAPNSDATTGSSTEVSPTDVSSTDASSTGGLATSEPGDSTSTGLTGTDGSGALETSPEPVEVVVPAVIATCVLRANGEMGYLGPQECEPRAVAADATGSIGVMVLDAAFNEQGGGGRPAQVYLRFDLPDLGGGAVTGAKLEVHAADGLAAGGPASGAVWTTAGFDLASLFLSPPAELALVAPDAGPVAVSAVLVWDLPPALVVPGDPLFLSLVTQEDDGVLYRSGLAEPGLTPVLRISVE